MLVPGMEDKQHWEQRVERFRMGQRASGKQRIAILKEEEDLVEEARVLQETDVRGGWRQGYGCPVFVG